MPPALGPELDAPPEVPDEVSEGMPDGASLLVPDGMVDEVPDVPPGLIPELLPEPSPVMPVHALSSIAHAMGNIHVVIHYSRLDKQRKYARGAHRGKHRECRE